MITYFFLYGEWVFSIFSPIQMIAAELIYLLALKKKAPFLPRILCALGGYLLFLLLVPPYNKENFTADDLAVLSVSAYATGYWLSVFSLSALVFLPCFQVQKRNVLFCCTAGYCTQHIASSIYDMLKLLFPPKSYVSVISLELCVCSVIYTVFWYFLARKIRFNRCSNLNNGYIVLFSSITILINILLSMFRRLEPIGEITKIAESGYSAICCVLVLFLMFSIFNRKELQYELDIISRMWLRDKEQYQLSKGYIDAVNMKCHDLKHVIRQLQDGVPSSYLAEMEKAVSLYDSVVKTGNEALDVILSEKSLYCLGQKIRFTCMLNGSRLHFMDDVDLYSCMGNALDNAIEAASKVVEPEKRLVSVSMREENDLICIRIENYFTGTLSFEHGLPVTTKSDKLNHGFGVKSMLMIAEKYGGRITFAAEDGIFGLNLFLPAGKQS